MPSGACVLRYEGARGVTWSVTFRDVDGGQVRERLGREAEGWNRQPPERELGKRLDRVERERWRKPTDETLAALVDEFLDEYLPSRGRRRSTILDYTNTLRGHVLPALDEGVTCNLCCVLLDSVGVEERSDLRLTENRRLRCRDVQGLEELHRVRLHPPTTTCVLEHRRERPQVVRDRLRCELLAALACDVAVEELRSSLD